jgi:hypothetical protein
VNEDWHECSGEQIVELMCPFDSGWKNHSVYVICAAHAAEGQLEACFTNRAEKDTIISARAKSGCGKKRRIYIDCIIKGRILIMILLFAWISKQIGNYP